MENSFLLSLQLHPIISVSLHHHPFFFSPPSPTQLTNIFFFKKKEVGRAIGFRTQIECQLDPCGTVNKHEYLDTRVVLDKKDMSFGDTAVGNKAKATWKTPDGGLTWTADKIVVEAHTYA